MHHSTEVLPNKTKVWISDAHRFGTDSLLLASFCNAKRNWTVYDLGSGCGIVLLSLVDKGLQGNATGVELDPEGTALLSGAITENGLHTVTAICQDIKTLAPQTLCDLVVANPPYFTAGILPPAQRRASARHETTATLADFCAAAARLLKDGGRFCLCFPPNRLTDLLVELRTHRLEPKRMQMVRNKPEGEPWLVLLDARKNGGKGLQILPERLLPHGTPIQY